MVIATVSLDTERFELKSLEGAFVVLKPMSWGEKLKRQEMATGDARMKGIAGKKAEPEIAVKMLAQLVAEYEFKHCIVDHNLEAEDKHGNPRPLDFNSGSDVGLLSGRVGDEINQLIAEQNNFDGIEDPDDKGNSPTDSDE